MTARMVTLAAEGSRQYQTVTAISSKPGDEMAAERIYGVSAQVHSPILERAVAMFLIRGYLMMAMELPGANLDSQLVMVTTLQLI